MMQIMISGNFICPEQYVKKIRLNIIKSVINCCTFQISK